MDEIDITSAEFSLHSLVPSVKDILPSVKDILPSVKDSLPSVKDSLPSVKDILPSVNEIIDITSHGEYNIYIYIGILLLIGIVGFLGYKYYENTKRKRVTFQDKLDECYGGVCQRV
jgi:hypothetical protein